MIVFNLSCNELIIMAISWFVCIHMFKLFSWLLQYGFYIVLVDCKIG